MRPRELKLLLKDVQDAIQQIERFTLGMTLVEYEGAELGMEAPLETAG